MYTEGLQQLLAGNVDLINDSIVGVLVDTNLYTVDLEADATQADIPVDARIAEATITGNTLDGSTFRANDLTFNKVQGTQVGAIVLIKDTGVYSTSTLLAYIENSTELPTVPNGEDITIRWDTGPAGIFSL